MTCLAGLHPSVRHTTEGSGKKRERERKRERETELKITYLIDFLYAQRSRSGILKISRGVIMQEKDHLGCATVMA